MKFVFSSSIDAYFHDGKAGIILPYILKLCHRLHLFLNTHARTHTHTHTHTLIYLLIGHITSTNYVVNINKLNSICHQF